MSARDDDAWEDLVRRLEATDSGNLEPRDPRDAADPSDPAAPADASTPQPHPSDTASHPIPPVANTPETPAPGTGTPTPGPRAVRGFDFAGDPALLGPEPGRAAGSGPRDWQAAEDPLADTFIPEEPEPVLAGRPDRVVAWIAALGLPLIMFIVVVFFGGKASPLLFPMLGIGTIAAWGYLFWKLPTHRADEGDDGARL